MRRVLPAMIVLALGAAACTTTAAPTTTTAAPTSTATTSTTQPTGRITLSANGPAFVHEGDRGAYVEALQHYLVCTGHEQPSSDGGAVSVDGVYGPITADAVAYYQAELRRIPTGEPDEETFASLARDCREERTIGFAESETTLEIAGNAAPGDEDVFVLSARAGQVLTLRPTEGQVTINVASPDGSTLEGALADGSWEAEIPDAGDYRIRVSADAATSFLIAIASRSPNVVASDFGPMVLQPDGIGIADIGDDPDNTAAVIELVLGPPFVDTGWQSDVPGCVGSNRHLTWIIQAADGGDNHPAVLVIDFADLGGTPFFAQYAYRSFDLAALDPIAQGLTTEDGISLGSDLETFTDVYGDVQFYDETRGLTAFQEKMVAGFEPGAEPADRLIWYIAAGDDGCEDFG